MFETASGDSNRSVGVFLKLHETVSGFLDVDLSVARRLFRLQYSFYFGINSKDSSFENRDGSLSMKQMKQYFIYEVICTTSEVLPMLKMEKTSKCGHVPNECLKTKCGAVEFLDLTIVSDLDIIVNF